jgi:hypothetical protein
LEAHWKPSKNDIYTAILNCCFNMILTSINQQQVGPNITSQKNIGTSTAKCVDQLTGQPWIQGGIVY